MGDTPVVLVTKSYRHLLADKLQADGVNVGARACQERYISMDPVEIYGELAHRDRFLKVANSLIATAAKGIEEPHNCVAACGECACLLWS